MTIEDIANEILIFQQAGYDAETQFFLQSSNIILNKKYTVESDQSIIAMVESGLGVCIMPELTYSEIKHTHVNIFPVMPERYRTIGIASVKNRPLSAAASKMQEHILQHISHKYGMIQ